MVIKDKKIITLGAEQEYCSAPNVNLHSIIFPDHEDLGIQYEYYNNMIEFNEILFSSTTSYERIEENLTKIREIIENKALEIYDYIRERRGRGVKIFLSSMPFYIAGIRALVFNGLHLHINTGGVLIPIHKLRKLVAFFKRNLNLDIRFDFSHHLWGGVSRTDYGFKKKLRFTPAVITSHNTIEMRTFTYDDLKEKQYLERLAFFIHLITTNNKAETICKVLGWDWGVVEKFWESRERMDIDIGDYMEGKYVYKNEVLEINYYDREISYEGSLYAVFRRRIKRIEYHFEEEL